jgi:hypothetical protein
MNKLFAVLMVAVAAIAFSSKANAQGCDGCGYGYGYLYNSLDYRVPYFAAHPPVYYSYPVPRTYGYSPFAYPPNVMTPEVVAPVQPAVISNPYVPAGEAKPASAEQDRAAAVKTQAQPLVIVNPFVNQGQVVARTDAR